MQITLKMKTAKYDYYPYYHEKIHTVCLALQNKAKFHFFISVSISRCKVKSVGVKIKLETMYIKWAYLAESRERTWECKHSEQSHKTQ